MTEGGIEEIIKRIREITDDEIIRDFLINLIYDEVEYLWSWKEVYRKKVKEYTEKWGDTFED